MIELLVTFVILGLIAWFVVTYIPMAEPFKTGFVIICAIIVLLMLLNAIGVTHVAGLNWRLQ